MPSSAKGVEALFNKQFDKAAELNGEAYTEYWDKVVPKMVGNSDKALVPNPSRKSNFPKALLDDNLDLLTAMKNKVSVWQLWFNDQKPEDFGNKAPEAGECGRKNLKADDLRFGHSKVS